MKDLKAINKEREGRINLSRYKDLIETVSKVEYNKFSHLGLIDLQEVINLANYTVYYLINNTKTVFNEAYITKAMKWAIRNELRNRYRWYGVKQNKLELSEDDANDLKDAIYKTVLSTDELFDSEKSFEVKDIRKNPEENCEFSMMSATLRSVVATLPKKERDLIESKFFKEKKLHELSDEFSISPSRISRIIKSGLDKIKDELIKSEVI